MLLEYLIVASSMGCLTINDTGFVTINIDKTTNDARHHS